MRVAAKLILASAMALGMASAAWSQTPAAKPAAAAQSAPAPAAAPSPAAAPAAAPAAQSAAFPPPPQQAPQPARAACTNPNALGVARTVEIDTTGGPGFGFEHFKELDFLRDKEVVLTFDDGPWPHNTPAVLKALAEQCTTGVFFSIGKHATYEPEILKQVYAAGHVIGTHTWSHANLNDKKLSEAQRKEEIEKGISAVKWALGGISPAAFFRFPALQHPPEMVTYLGNRNVAIFSCDIDSFDFKASKPEKVIETVMKKLESKGKGIVLMHDFQHGTSEALPELLKRMKAGGYKIVQVKGKTPVEPLPQYKEIVLKEMGGGLDEARPMSSVVRTISGN